ncbi:leukocyte surface antigen CD53 [Trichinella spiralis]|uniref:leukocyte surface antigen CD53 n=1 Tax=Trichinella spiralis TaxID=6334 RepID=UPI0001EFBBB1|nr:leukocyte surface antigen CD53 [Trichinella spiralis]
MVLGCGAKIAGTVCLGVGIWLIVDNLALDRLINASENIADSPMMKEIASKPQAVHDIGIILTAGGAVIFVIAFLGCCGAMKEWRPLLVLYSICLMIILAVEIAAAIYAAVNRTNLEVSTKLLMYESIKDYNGSSSSANGIRAAWDSIMNQYECCGIESNWGEFNNPFRHLAVELRYRGILIRIAGVVNVTEKYSNVDRMLRSVEACIGKQTSYRY